MTAALIQQRSETALLKETTLASAQRIICGNSK